VPQSPKTIAEVLTAAGEYLAGKGVDDARLAIELLVARLLNCRRLELPLRAQAVLPENLLAALRRGVRRVAGGEPVQYVLGQWDFMGRTFKVDRRALIPRPDTECLVAAVLACAPLWAQSRPAIVDIGTGSGCIAISLALARPDGLYIGLDVSGDALALARENAAALGVADRIAFTGAELCDTVEPEMLDAVVSNPPYVRTADFEKLPVHIRCHEPRLALDGGPDGLSVIEGIVQDAAIALKNGGRLFLEIGWDQAAAVKALFAQAGFDGVHVGPDLAGRDRVVAGVLAR
jgi:release factor glutamine methyltransferase